MRRPPGLLLLLVAACAGDPEDPARAPDLVIRHFAPGAVPDGVQERFHSIGVPVPADRPWTMVLADEVPLYWPNKDPRSHVPNETGFWEIGDFVEEHLVGRGALQILVDETAPPDVLTGVLQELRKEGVAEVRIRWAPIDEPLDLR